MNPVFELEGVKKSYQGRMVVDVERLSIHPGEIFGIVGPSGSGKSTLLRLINFLEPVDAGRIMFDGVERNSRGIPLEVRRSITTVFQHPALIDASVRSNIEFGLRLRGVSNPRKIVDEWLDRIGMTGLADAKARTLSGGEAQRVALARAVILQPAVLLLDEPTANLDPANVELIEKVIHDLSRERTTIVLVTHNIFQAKRLAQRVAFLLAGKIVEVNETHLFFEVPADPRTAAFVRGEMVY